MADARAPHPDMTIKFIQLLPACLIISSLAWTPSGAQLKPVSGQQEIRGVWVHPSLFGAGKDTAAGVLHQIQLTKQEKAQGFVLFSSSSLKNELLDGIRISR